MGKGSGDYGACECPGGICCIIFCSPCAWMSGEGVNLCCIINTVLCKSIASIRLHMYSVAHAYS